jgi:GT2 family glycosyltransferase
VSAPATYRFGTPRNQHLAAARWHAHLRGLAVAIHEISGLGERPAMSDDLPHVLIIIVTWNKQEYLQRLLNSIQRSSYPHYSVLVVDNASTDNTEEIIKQFDFVIHKKLPENVGGAGGFNAGLKYAVEEDYPYVWLLDDDTEVDSHALKKLVNFYLSKENNSIGFLGSRINLLQHKELIQEVGGRLDIRRADVLPNCALETKADKKVYEVDVVAACSLFTSREVIRAVGPIDDSFFITCDDVEWSLRTKCRGYKNFVISDAVIYHNFIWAGNKLFDSFRVYYHIRNFLQVLQNYLTIPQFAWVLFRRLFLYFVLSVHFLISKQKDALKNIIRAYLDYMNNRMGKREFSREVEDSLNTSIPYPRSAVLCTFFLEDMSKLLTWINNNPNVEMDILSFRKAIHLFLDTPRKEYNLVASNLLQIFKNEYDFIVCYERSLLFYVLAIRFKKFFLLNENRLIKITFHERVWLVGKLFLISMWLSFIHVFLYPVFLLKKIFGKSPLE